MLGEAAGGGGSVVDATTLENMYDRAAETAVVEAIEAGESCRDLGFAAGLLYCADLRKRKEEARPRAWTTPTGRRLLDIQAACAKVELCAWARRGVKWAAEIQAALFAGDDSTAERLMNQPPQRRVR